MFRPQEWKISREQNHPGRGHFCDPAPQCGDRPSARRILQHEAQGATGADPAQTVALRSDDNDVGRACRGRKYGTCERAAAHRQAGLIRTTQPLGSPACQDHRVERAGSRAIFLVRG